MDEDDISARALEACVREHLGPPAGDRVFTPIPTGKYNRSYFVEDGDRGWVLRIAPPPDRVVLFYERDIDGLAQDWIQRMKNSISSLAWRFSSHRMVMDYTNACYVPAAGGLSCEMKGPM